MNAANLNRAQKAAMLTAMGQAAAKHAPQGWGVVVIAAPLGDKVYSGGEFTSNILREDAIILLRETAARIERNWHTSQ